VNIKLIHLLAAVSSTRPFLYNGSCSLVKKSDAKLVLNNKHKNDCLPWKQLVLPAQAGMKESR
jgi:hypothetical protein